MHRFSTRHEKSYTKQGHKAVKLPVCRHCDEEMFLRTSRLNSCRRRDTVISLTNGLMYKCPDCDWVKMYEVPCNEEYFKYVYGLRGKDPLFYPSIEEFEVNEKVKEKLASLGYA